MRLPKDFDPKICFWYTQDLASVDISWYIPSRTTTDHVHTLYMNCVPIIIVTIQWTPGWTTSSLIVIALSRGKRDNIPKPQNEITSVVPLNGGEVGWNGHVVLGLCSFLFFFRRDCELLASWLVAMCFGPDLVLSGVKKTFIYQTIVYTSGSTKCVGFSVFSFFPHSTGDDKKWGAKKDSFFCYWVGSTSS